VGVYADENPALVWLTRPGLFDRHRSAGSRPYAF